MRFENAKLSGISKSAKISKLSERHENFFARVIFVMNLENDLKIDKNFAI